MRLELIQTNCSAINSIYIYKNFLEDLEYLDLLKQKVDEHTTKSELDYKTNVIAKMTSYEKLLEDKNFERIHRLIIETLHNTINLRNPTANSSYDFTYVDSWAMCHSEGDYTRDHIHGWVNFSGSFYLSVPSITEMWFEDFQQSIELKDNMLLLFPGLTKHRVGPHKGKENRYSMAFNINIEESKN